MPPRALSADHRDARESRGAQSVAMTTDHCSSFEPDIAADDNESDTTSESSFYSNPSQEFCRYCEGPLPEVPSKTLLKLESELRSRSHPMPAFASRRNPYPLRTYPVYQHVAYCQQHKLEFELLPQARASGWPIEMDASRTATRISSLPLEKLISVLRDPTDNIVYKELRKSYPHADDNFFTSLKGQMAVFESKFVG
jgi:hypothetical protein